MKKQLYLPLLGIVAIVFMSFYSNSTPTEKYEYLSIHSTVWVKEPLIYIFQSDQPVKTFEYGKKDSWDFSRELARVQRYEDEGWELMEMVDQNVQGNASMVFLMRRPRK